MERTRERVAILLNDVRHSAVIDFRCVSSRILWIKFKLSRVKVCVVVGYNPSEGDSEERENDYGRVVKFFAEMHTLNTGVSISTQG